MKNFSLNSWDKLILLLVMLGIVLYLNSLLSPNGKNILKSSSGGAIISSPSPILNQTQQTQGSPTPTITNSIQRIRGGEKEGGFGGDN